MRLPLTIWRFTLLELWRMLLLTAGVLVTVISFAVSVRLTAEGKLAPLATLKYMLYAMPPMLQYALPFAAGFAATLAYHRAVLDNEVVAASASGVSHRSLIAPALASGLALSAMLMLLTGQVIPRFLRHMEDMVTQDATRTIESSIKAGRPLTLGNMVVHADGVFSAEPEKGDDAFKVLVLSRVFALEYDAQGKLRREASAAQAVVRFSPATQNDADGREMHGGLTEVALVLKNASVFERSEGVVSTFESLPVYATIPGVFTDDPKFLTSGELRELPEHPDRMKAVDVRRRNLAHHLAEFDAIEQIRSELRSAGQAVLVDESGRRFTIRAAEIRWDGSSWAMEPSPNSGAIEAEMRSAAPGEGSAVNHFSARAAGIRSDIGKDWRTRRLALQLKLELVTMRGQDSERAAERTELSFGNLLPANNPLPAHLARTSRELLDEVGRRSAERGSEAFLAEPASDLRKRIESLNREVVSKRHERWAYSAAGLVMVVAGALTAMRLAGSMPLAVYLWSFFPALIAVVTISAGQQMAHKLGLNGLALLWGGVGILAAYAAGAFWIVRKH